MAYDLSDYVDVAERVQKFHEKYPEGSLQSDWRLAELDGKQTIIVKAYAYRQPDDAKPGIGHATEPVPGLTKFTKNSELMVGETSAWGRALAALGFEVKRGIASREEVMNRRDADGGGDADDGTGTQRDPGHDSGAAAVSTNSTGFVSEKQRKYFDRLMAKANWQAPEQAAVTRYLQEGAARSTVSAAIDALKDGSEAEQDGLIREAMEWQSKLSDVPYDETA